ncbi:MAG TPA: hypothetical protein VGM80_06290 [Gaiellaceae bacterium]|jgi:uncharacterized membrane protein
MTSSTLTPAWRAAAFGAASGLRATAVLAVLAARPAMYERPGLPAALSRRVARSGYVIELVLDKLPVAGSRLTRAGLGARLIGAASGAAIGARSEREPLGPAVAAALGAVFVAARVGHDLRVRFPGVFPALVEDLAVIALASLAAPAA